MTNYNTNKEFLVITFIKMKNLFSLRKIISTIPRGIETVSYLDIYNKLLKKEDHINEPSDALISTYIIKKLNTLLLDEHTTHLCYVLDISDNDIHDKLINIMDFINATSIKPVNFELITDEDEILEKTKMLNITSAKHEIL